MHGQGISIVILQEIAPESVDDPRFAERESGRVITVLEAASRRLDAVDVDSRRVEKGTEEADGVGASPNTGNQRVGETPGLVESLRGQAFRLAVSLV